MIYLLAGNGSEAEARVASSKLNQGTYVIVHAGTARKKGPDDYLIACGTWRDRPDRPALQTALRECGFAEKDYA